jgi:hypothetical protein
MDENPPECLCYNPFIQSPAGVAEAADARDLKFEKD